MSGDRLRYFDPQIETLPRAELERLQELRLLALLPLVYERSGLIRQAWDAAGVTPVDIRSLADFRARAPFIDKDMIRAFRDANDDPCGGLRIADYTDVPHVGFTSGTTGDPTPVPNGKGSAIEAEIRCISSDAPATARTRPRVCSAMERAPARIAMLSLMSKAYFTTLNGRPTASRTGL